MDLSLTPEQEAARQNAVAQGQGCLALEDPVSFVLALEELAAHSTLQAEALLEPIIHSSRSALGLAALSLGVARAALLEVSGRTEGASERRQSVQWRVADIATELDAARLLTWKAASTGTQLALAMARLSAGRLASRAVQSALQIVGASALEAGSSLLRLQRLAQGCELALLPPDAQALLIAQEICVVD